MFSFQKILEFLKKREKKISVNQIPKYLSWGEKSQLMQICTLSMLCVQSRIKSFLSKASCFFPLYQTVEEAHIPSGTQ